MWQAVVPPVLGDVAVRLASSLGRDRVGGFPLVSLKDADFSTLGREDWVSRFEVTDDGVRVKLRTTD